jgi:translation elongation factor EF-Ts
MKITAEMVKELRTATGAGVLDAKKALEAIQKHLESLFK